MDSIQAQKDCLLSGLLIAGKLTYGKGARMWLIGIILALWALFATIGVVGAKGFMDTVGIAMLAYGPLAFFAWYRVNRALAGEKLRDDMLAALGVTRGAGYDHFEDGTGIAVNPEARMVAVMARGGYKAYEFSQVRSWSVREERPGGAAVGLGLAGVTTAAAHNVRMAREAAANTGLFLLVKDLDNPEWRVAMGDRMMRARWMELLRQELNETPQE